MNDSKEQVYTRNWLINVSEEHIGTISNYEEMVDAVIYPKSNPSSNPKVATRTISRKFQQNLLRIQFVPNIIQGAFRPIDQIITEDLPGIEEIFGARQMVLPKDIDMDTARSGACIFYTLRELIWTGRYNSTSQFVNTAYATARLTPPIPSFNSTSVSPARTVTQDIVSSRRSIIATKAKNVEPLDTLINRFLAVHCHSRSIFSKIIGHKTVPR